MTFTIATTLARNQTHPDLLKSALQLLLDQDDETLEIIAKNNKRLLFNKKLLMLFSPSLRTCLADIPCCGVQPSISAPSVSANCVAKVQEILLNTVNNVPIQWSDDDVEDIVEAAEVLGIEMKNIRLSLQPRASLSVKRKRESVLPKIEPDVLELPDEPVTQEVDEDDLEEGALTINVDVSSDEDDEYEPAAGVDTAEENSNSEMLTEDSSDVISDDDESLQEESESKMSFSFLKSQDPESEDIVFGSVNDSQEEAVLVSADEALNDKTVPEDDAEPKIRCEICGKAQRGPSSLREHYSLTHFFQELFDKFVAPTGDHTWCRY